MIDNKKLYELTDLDNNTFRVLWYLSYGYDWALSIGKEYYEASYSQIRKYTSIKDNHTIIKCIDKLISLGLITKETKTIGGNCKSTTKFTSKIVVEKIHQTSGNNPLDKWKKSTSSSGNNPLVTSGNNPLISKERKSKEKYKENSKGVFSSGDCFDIDEVN